MRRGLAVMAAVTGLALATVSLAAWWPAWHLDLPARLLLWTLGWVATLVSATRWLAPAVARWAFPDHQESS